MQKRRRRRRRQGWNKKLGRYRRRGDRGWGLVLFRLLFMVREEEEGERGERGAFGMGKGERST